MNDAPRSLNRLKKRLKYTQILKICRSSAAVNHENKVLPTILLDFERKMFKGIRLGSIKVL